MSDLSSPFPVTRKAWILQRLQARSHTDLLEVVHHIMEAYHKPLHGVAAKNAYYSTEEPEEVVQSFLTDKVTRPNYLAEWVGSQRLLREWLSRGVRLQAKAARTKHLRELIRRDATDTLGRSCLTSPGPLEGLVRDEFEEQVGRAIELARNCCEAAGHRQHWQIFEAHYLQQRSYREIGAEFGMSERDARSRARVGRRALERAYKAYGLTPPT